jgi:cellulose synthase/poly-beta-1,6-N-acetylglucosamine synthase-like glycosyltransferase
MTEKQNVNDASGGLPFVSVIVPVYNDEKRIGECIESFLTRLIPETVMRFLLWITIPLMDHAR